MCAGNTHVTETQVVDKLKTDGNWTSSSCFARPLRSQERRKERRITSVLFPSAHQQYPCVSPILGVRICGNGILTVPESQPYLARAIHSNLLGRFCRPQNAALKVNVTAGHPSSTRLAEGAPEYSGDGIERNDALETSCKQADPRTRGGASSGTAQNDVQIQHKLKFQCDGDLKEPIKQWKFGSLRWEEQPTAIRHALPVSPEGTTQLTPLKRSHIANSGRTRSLCVSSISTNLPQCNFEEKAVRVTGVDSLFSLDNLGVSVVCKKGYRPNCPNNDGFFVCHVHGCTVCCVLDGHGPFGHDICNIVQQDLLRLIIRNPDLPLKSGSVLQEAFLRAHNNLETKCSEFRLDSKLSGTTVTIIVYLREQNRLVVAHVGNSRAVLCKLSKYGCGVRAIDLTVDHIPTNIRELRRIIKAGGEVRAPRGDGLHRIFLTDKYLPGLAVARSIGDTLAGSAGVIAKPDIKEYRVDVKRDPFLLLCTDGVWNVLSSQEAVDIAHSAERKGWRTAPEELARESWRRWINQEQIFADDMTALFLRLR
ncbi:protein phosphatase 2C, putative [Eimeria necatrix]|uniref:Protein phosphatase 2C, putative n=1 Tax=Eimeria necatrix TaxID=51315 RepID=U6MYA7_9EIME|nr:protein phosphatase 2C, putative [Eimeria necatrix]CDJ68951.1 protein phosphatase 2C, putative [Eimeria necatrix]